MQPEQIINKAIDNLKADYIDKTIRLRGHTNVWKGRKEILLKLDVLVDVRKEIKTILEGM